MGYTHHWDQHRHFTPKEWTDLLAHTVRLIQLKPPNSTNAGGYYEDEPLRIAYEDDAPEHPPQIDEHGIRFNGIGELGNETFLLKREETGSIFCKTERKPYDLMVCAVLIVAHDIAPGALHITSDGTALDWEPARQFASKALGWLFALPDSIRERF